MRAPFSICLLVAAAALVSPALGDLDDPQPAICHVSLTTGGTTAVNFDEADAHTTAGAILPVMRDVKSSSDDAAAKITAEAKADGIDIDNGIVEEIYSSTFKGPHDVAMLVHDAHGHSSALNDGLALLHMPPSTVIDVKTSVGSEASAKEINAYWDAHPGAFGHGGHAIFEKFVDGDSAMFFCVQVVPKT